VSKSQALQGVGIVEWVLMHGTGRPKRCSDTSWTGALVRQLRVGNLLLETHLRVGKPRVFKLACLLVGDSILIWAECLLRISRAAAVYVPRQRMVGIRVAISGSACFASMEIIIIIRWVFRMKFVPMYK
jgi:hypothetical protein